MQLITIKESHFAADLAVSMLLSLVTFTSIESINSSVKLICLHCELELRG